MPDFNIPAAVQANDQTHLDYWRAVDQFFLPGNASAETEPHVIQMHAAAFGQWRRSFVAGESMNVWKDYIGRPDVQESFRYVRLHQRRLLEEFYGSRPEDIFDALWKFGANLLPSDGLRPQLPQHTMNGVGDWFIWIPQLYATLSDPEVNEEDLALARAWQMGIAADGLVRADRRPSVRLKIPSFDSTSPTIREDVIQAYRGAPKDNLHASMIGRAKIFSKSPNTPIQPMKHLIKMSNFEFEPATLAIAPGDSVEWTNEDGDIHTATSDDDGVAFDTGDVEPGATSAARTFADLPVDGIPYHCEVHTHMKGRIIRI
jgi:plastocyanin